MKTVQRQHRDSGSSINNRKKLFERLSILFILLDLRSQFSKVSHQCEEV